MQERPYENTLRFLWAIHYIPNEIDVPATSQLQDEATIAWEKEMSSLIADKSKEATVDLTGEIGTSAVANSGAITAITKLSESTISHQNLAL